MFAVVGALVVMVLISTALQATDRKQRLAILPVTTLALVPDQRVSSTGIWSLVDRELGFYGSYESRSSH